MVAIEVPISMTATPIHLRVLKPIDIRLQDPVAIVREARYGMSHDIFILMINLGDRLAIIRVIER